MSTSNNNKASKRKKSDHELKADNIDNTVDVKTILEELQHKNIQAHSFYSHNLRQRNTTKTNLRNYHYVVPGHPINAFSEDWCGDLNLDYFESFPYKSLPPKMISALRNIEKSDPVTKYMKNQINWQHTLLSMKLSASFSNMIQKYEELNDEVVRCPKHLVDMAAHLDSKPDPYFDCTYNWYYAGSGNLQVVCIDWIDYLLYSEFNYVYLTQLNKTDMIIKTDFQIKFECKENIFETICSDNNTVALRTRNNIYILKINTSNDEISFEKLKLIGSELPYTSIAFDNHHKNVMYITTLDQKVSILNLDRMKVRSVKLNAKLTTLVDNWNTIIGSGREIYTHITRKTICVYDKRVNHRIHSWTQLRSITDEIACNDISVARHFEGTSCLYFATDHHLFLMDLRYHSNDKLKVVQRWTHGMECVPTYISYCNFEFNKDLICLSSQWVEDMCVVPSYNDRFIKDTESGGVTIPYRPPSILNALNEVRHKMLYFDLYNPIDSRLCTSITGNVIIEQGEKYDVLMQNSLGDISCHTIFPEHLETFIENDSPEVLSAWSQDYQLEKKVFEVSSIENIANVLNELKKVTSDDIIDGRIKKGSRFNEQEITDIFENEEVESGLQEIWKKGGDETVAEKSSLAINLYYSDEEKSVVENP